MFKGSKHARRLRAREFRSEGREYANRDIALFSLKLARAVPVSF